MNPKQVALPWGDDSILLDLPANWHLDGVLEPSPMMAVPDAREETRQSLSCPVGSARLSERVKPGMKVALVIDDASRPTPVHQLLPPVLTELHAGGVQMADISVVPALGVHRAMQTDEVVRRTGLSDLNIVTHDCDDLEKLTYFGKTSRGTPVYFNRTVAEADFIVSIGCIEPHIIASFGGGYKNLLPGVAGRTSIAHNHTLNCTPGTFNMVGQPIERNPMRLDLEEAGAMLKPPVFIINAVLNSAMQVVRVVTGDPILAHRAGTEISASIYGVPIPALADVVITASRPMDQDLRQGVKALANNIRALRPGGCMLTLVRAEEGVGVFGLANKKLPVGKKSLRSISGAILPLVPKLKLNSMGEEDRFFLYFALQAMRTGTLYMYSPTIPAEKQANLPFIDFVAQPMDAIRLSEKKFPNGARVVVLPYGGSTYPILP
jgi:nickel-dependent lactate racemase